MAEKDRCGDVGRNYLTPQPPQHITPKNLQKRLKFIASNAVKQLNGGSIHRNAQSCKSSKGSKFRAKARADPPIN
jgi:hypothetical protein